MKHDLILIRNGELDSTNNISIYADFIDKYHTDDIRIFDNFFTRDNRERSGIRYYLVGGVLKDVTKHQTIGTVESLFLYIVDKNKKALKL